jgi:hypothetical protein
MGLFGVLFSVELIGSDGAIVWMVDQFEFHGFFAPWAEKRVAAKAFEKELLKGFSGNDAEASGANGCFYGKYSGKLPAGFLVADMAVQTVVSDALEAFGENVLNHAPDKTKGGQGFIFDLPHKLFRGTANEHKSAPQKISINSWLKFAVKFECSWCLSLYFYFLSLYFSSLGAAEGLDKLRRHSHKNNHAG